MLWVNAVADSAKMVKLKSFMDDTFMNYVGDAMGKNRKRSSVYVYSSVSFVVERALPLPASGLFVDLNARKKTNTQSCFMVDHVATISGGVQKCND